MPTSRRQRRPKRENKKKRKAAEDAANEAEKKKKEDEARKSWENKKKDLEDGIKVVKVEIKHQNDSMKAAFSRGGRFQDPRVKDSC